MKRPFSEVRDSFLKGNIYFSVNGTERLGAGDSINYIPGVEVEPYCGFLVGNNVWSMGAFSYSWSSLPLNTKVGRYCSIARGVTVLGKRHPMEWISTSSFTYDGSFSIFSKFVEHEGSGSFPVRKAPNYKEGVLIGNDVWIGANVTLKPGISIGNGAVIAAGSMVTKDIPAYAVYGGNPAKHIKNRFSDSIVNKISLLEWWNYKFTDFDGLDFTNPLEFVSQFSDKKRKGEVLLYNPHPLIMK